MLMYTLLELSVHKIR